MNYPKCIDSFHKLNLWLNFCNTIVNFKYFMQYILLPDLEHLNPPEIIILFQHIGCFVKGKNPELTEEINTYIDTVAKCVCKCAIDSKTN